MNQLEKELQEIIAWFAKKNLDVDVFKEHPEGKPNEPFRAYITSKGLGGLLAQKNDGDDVGWIPIYPERVDSYPMKGKWYSPYSTLRRKKIVLGWKEAIEAALEPTNFPPEWFDEVGKRVAISRAEARCHALKKAVMIAVLRRE